MHEMPWDDVQKNLGFSWVPCLVWLMERGCACFLRFMKKGCIRDTNQVPDMLEVHS
jgi:hypothetical protein